MAHLATMHICAFVSKGEAEGVETKVVQKGIPEDAILGELITPSLRGVSHMWIFF